MKKFFLFFGILSLSFLSAQSKTEKIKELMTLTKMMENMDIIINYVIETNQKNYPNSSPEFWKEFRNEATKKDLINLLIPVYDKNFSEKELEDMITFYKTPSGQAVITKMPQIYIESSKVGEVWGREIGEKIAKKINENSTYSSPPPPKRN